jgi:RNA polymerase sigma-70 factor, ECF subfamily
MSILTTTVESGHATFEALDEQYRALIYKRAYYLLRHREDAEDVTQEVLFKASRAYNRLTHYDDIPAWLWQITTNAVRDFLRSPGKRPMVFAPLEDAFHLQDELALDPYLLCDREDFGEEVERAWGRTPFHHKQVLSLLIKGQSPEEISRSLGYPSRKMYTTIKNARDAFKRRYKPTQEVA